jgi:hypothetical protein
MAHYRRKRGGSFSNISFSRSAAEAPQNLAANISADVVLLLQYYGSLEPTQKPVRHHRPTITTALVRRRRHGRAFACARIASSRSASLSTISVSI